MAASDEKRLTRSARKAARSLSRDNARAMSEENVEVVRALWEAYARDDFDRVLSYCDPYLVMVTLEEGPVYGLDASRQNYERWRDAWDDPEIAVEEILGAGDRVFVSARFRARGRASGAEVDGRFYELYTMRNGKILRVEEFNERAQGLEAAGLQE